MASNFRLFSLAIVLSLLIYIGRRPVKRLTQENNLNPTSTLLKVEQLSVQTKDQKVLLEHLNFT